MVTESERQVLDPNVTQELTPEEITVVDAVRFEEFESGCVVIVHATQPPPPRRAKDEPQDPNLAANEAVEPARDDVDSEDVRTLRNPACDEHDRPATPRRD